MDTFLSEGEILKWNERISSISIGLNIKVYGEYDNNNNVNIGFRTLSSIYTPYHPIQQTSFVNDPEFKYDIIFSVSSNRVDYFFDIFNKYCRSKITNGVIGNNHIIQPIEDPLSTIKDKKEYRHKLLGKEYIRFTYSLSGRLSSIMGMVMYIEDSINFFQLIYGYNADGSEESLTEYNIGSLVSTKKDRNSDYIILDFKFVKNSNSEYEVKYIASRMTISGSIITYNEMHVFSDDELCFNRNGRIDEIIN